VPKSVNTLSHHARILMGVSLELISNGTVSGGASHSSLVITGNAGRVASGMFYLSFCLHSIADSN
jgi:hypothetical protein